MEDLTKRTQGAQHFTSIPSGILAPPVNTQLSKLRFGYMKDRKICEILTNQGFQFFSITKSVFIKCKLSVAAVARLKQKCI